MSDSIFLVGEVIDDTEFQSVTDDANTKDRFIVVDAMGVMDTPLAETVQPLERKPSLSLKDLFKQVAFGSKDPHVPPRSPVAWPPGQAPDQG